MTDERNPILPAGPPDGDAAAAAAERPAHRRSVFFDHEPRIRELLEAGRSYRQILRMLRLGHMHRSVLARWCVRQGLRSAAPSRHHPRAADKKPAPPSSAAADSTPASAPQVPASPLPAADAATALSSLFKRPIR